MRRFEQFLSLAIITIDHNGLHSDSDEIVSKIRKMFLYQSQNVWLTDHILDQIGKPVYYRDVDTECGSWMRDSSPRSQEDESKFWMTTDRDDRQLLEFENKEAFRNKNVSRTHHLPFRFSGNFHVVHGGHFYYQQFGTNKLIKHDLSTNDTSFKHVDGAAFQPSTSHLYTTDHRYMDITTDENGLWVIFSSDQTQNTLILKVDPQTLGTENGWNLTADHRTVGDMFIAYGVLYAVESATDTFTRIKFAFDLYVNSLVPVSVNFTNPFRHNTFISYNPRHGKIYAWDSRNLIEYPIRFVEKTAEQDNDLTDDTYDPSRR